MASYKVIAQGNSVEELQQAIPTVDDIPPGSPTRITITLPSWAPIGGIADIGGAEYIASWFVGEMDVTDVRSPNGTTIVIEGRAVGALPLTLIFIVVGLLAALGIMWLVRSIILEADILPQLPGLGKLGLPLIVIGLIAVAVIKVKR